MSKAQIYGLTVRRPWGFAIARLDKRIENRTWNCPLPIGSFLAIHNGKKWEEEGAAFVRNLNRSQLIDNPTEEDDPPGAIIAIAKFTGNVTESRSPWFVGPIGWQLSDVVAIDPVECKGQQGLWKPSEEILMQVRENYRDAVRSMQLLAG